MAMASLLADLAVFLFLLNFLTVSLANQDDLLITTKHGRVKGKLLTVLGGEVRAFLGIPYAKPPVGTLRFRAPERVDKWEGVKDATQFPNSCYQVPDTTFPGFIGEEMWNANRPLSEDCLYLNVWSPQINKTQPPLLAPVLVWIYGGGFTTGTSSLDIYDGRFLSKTEGVVVVSMNYRLGAFGFLSLPDNKNIRGNAGLLDQRLALEWVANNIAAFGGDPSMVTLFGESAGSGSVGFHLLSPGSQPFFQRAIMQSGSPNAPWATISQTEAGQRALKLATLLGCTTSHPAHLEMCLQQAEPTDITELQYKAMLHPSFLGFPFAPVVDGDFLPDKVEMLLTSDKLTKKDLMLGVNKDEGTYFLVYGVPGFSNQGPSLITRKEFLKGVEIVMKKESDVAKQSAIFQYTDWTEENARVKNRDLLGSLTGDQLFNCPVIEFAQRYSQNGGKTFLYLFNHRSSINRWPEWMGVMHGYEIEFIFGMPLNTNLGYTKNEVNMTKKLMKHWTNFARAGDPGNVGAKWPTFNLEQQEYVILNSNDLEHRTMMRAKECQLWNTLMPQLQTVSDNLASCLHASGIMLHCNSIFILIGLFLTLTFW
ncbi:acetylcholinesterase-like [Mugil cephalus]|uniref:acetylcholinesterase-like n=1 Tax=Mugil cephalus TaxID=48193 RepID=UPI001FB7AADE|nr:acetylcholinesterase-like [Mugil cephalus]